ncbi:MAG: hypothetical protein M1335_04450 [Chloroflexi bacterium]|nr:hypothetical protein [Chloroflexota bacterium]
MLRLPALSGEGSEARPDKTSFKLLGDWNNKDNSSTPPAYDSSYIPSRDGPDKVCCRCHSDIGNGR